MVRASAAAEKAGVPSASLVCEGFIGQAATTAAGLGLPNLPSALVPGHVDVQTAEELDQNVVAVTVDAVIESLTENPPPVRRRAKDPDMLDVVFEGTFDEVNRFFYENEWSDGLPIVPPTPERVQEFMRFTDRAAEEEIGVLLPDRRSATVWTVAVNGVMAGCRPEYMPILVALVEAMADPRYGVEHSGNTPGAETLIVAQRAADQRPRLQLPSRARCGTASTRTQPSGGSGACTSGTWRASSTTRPTRAPSATRGASCWRRTSR